MTPLKKQYVNLLRRPYIQISYQLSLNTLYFLLTLSPRFSAVKLCYFHVREKQNRVQCVGRQRQSLEMGAGALGTTWFISCEVLQIWSDGYFQIGESSVRFSVSPAYQHLILYLSFSKYVSNSRNWSDFQGALKTSEIRNTPNPGCPHLQSPLMAPKRTLCEEFSCQPSGALTLSILIQEIYNI